MMAAFFSLFQLVNLAFFLAVFIGRSVSLWLRQGINPFALGAGKTGLNRLLELLLLPWLGAWMLALVLAARHSPFQPLAALWRPLWAGWLPIQALGALAILAGDSLFVWALVSMRASWRIGIDERSAGGLVTGGAFAVSRNPIFLFIDLYFAGTFLLNGAPIFLLFAVITLAALHYQILQEEKFLAGRYGQPYREYCRRSGRYF